MLTELNIKIVFTWTRKNTKGLRRFNNCEYSFFSQKPEIAWEPFLLFFFLNYYFSTFKTFMSKNGGTYSHLIRKLLFCVTFKTNAHGRRGTYANLFFQIIIFFVHSQQKCPRMPENLYPFSFNSCCF